MSDLEQQEDYQMRVITLPQDLLMDVIKADTANNSGSGELNRKIADFTAAAVKSCREGEKILLPRDALTPDMSYLLDRARNWQAFGNICDRVMSTRLQLGVHLMLGGAEPMVETGLIRPDDFDRANPDYLNLFMRWTPLKGVKDGDNTVAKINAAFDGIPMESGPRLSHPFIYPETIYGLELDDSQFHGRFRNPNFDRKFYLSVAQNAASRKTMDETLCEISDQDGFEKMMLDTINMMEAVKFLHEKKMVHRDLKYENVFEGGVVFDNLSTIDARKLRIELSIFGTSPFLPESYGVGWKTPVSPYFRDIFALAISMAEAVSILTRTDCTPENFLNKIKKATSLSASSTEFLEINLFLVELEQYFFSMIKEEKQRKTADLIKKMIFNQGSFTVADAQRELAAIFGARI